MDGWEWILLAGGAYVAVTTLVRLMNRRREAILEEIRAQAEVEARQRQFERAESRRRQARERDQAAG
jgi:hypothetical protein